VKSKSKQFRNSKTVTAYIHPFKYKIILLLLPKQKHYLSDTLRNPLSMTSP